MKKVYNVRPILICLLIALVLEVLIFNHRFWLYGSSGNTASPKFFFEDGTLLEYGKIYSVSEKMVLVSEDLNLDIRSIYVDVADCNNSGWKNKDRQCVLHIATSVIDEGHAQFFEFPQNEVSPLVPDSMYLPVEAFGKVGKIKLTIADELEEISFNSIEINSGIPFHFNIFRLLLMLALMLGIYYALSADYFGMRSIGKEKKKSAIICALGLFALIFIVLLVHRQVTDWGTKLGYAKLAKAFTEGRVYVKENTDPILAGMDNPYDTGNRIALGAETKWDTAYFNNKYYVYFGVVPALVMHLPYYLVTGRDMSNMMAGCIIDVLFIIAAAFLTNELRKRINKDMPLLLQCILAVTFTLSSGLILLIKRASVYYVAIGSGLVFVLFGLALWFSATSKSELCVWKGILGSFCMAAAVGCRPQFAMASFLGIFIILDYFKNEQKSLYKVALLVMPYMPVAAGLMYYNYIRFGSPFDFGANYNLTGYDMVHMGIHIARIPSGIWYYLFNFPRLHLQFPFMLTDTVVTNYQGFMVNEPVIGGAIFMIPISFLCLRDLGKCEKGRFFALRVACYCIIPIVVAVDTVMCGILVRYQMDFRLYLMLPAIIIAMEYLTKDKCEEKLYDKRARLVAGLCVLTFFLCVLTIFCQYENPDYTYPAINPVFYCRMKTFLGG